MFRTHKVILHLKLQCGFFNAWFCQSADCRLGIGSVVNQKHGMSSWNYIKGPKIFFVKIVWRFHFSCKFISFVLIRGSGFGELKQQREPCNPYYTGKAHYSPGRCVSLPLSTGRRRRKQNVWSSWSHHNLQNEQRCSPKEKEHEQKTSKNFAKPALPKNSSVKRSVTPPKPELFQN